MSCGGFFCTGNGLESGSNAVKSKGCVDDGDGADNDGVDDNCDSDNYIVIMVIVT